MKRVFFIILLFISIKAYSQAECEKFKADYLQACELISNKYIYLERKLNMTRQDFFNKMKDHADEVQWDKKMFVKEIRQLRCIFPDGHFSWSISKNLSPFNGFYTLGFVCTFTTDSSLIVKKTYPYYNSQICTDDTITHINGIKACNYINELFKTEPQSTKHASQEVAARNLTLVKYNSPIVDVLADVELEVKNKYSEKKINFKWQRCGLTSDVFEARNDSSLLLVQRNGYLSLEEIPIEATAIHKSLYLYREKKEDLSFSILHVRDFFSWDTSHMDEVMAAVKNEEPDFLIIDLKDCAGGCFDNMLYLSHALGLTEPYRFFYDIIKKDNKRVSGVSNFNFISNKIVLKYKWDGKVILRTNEISGSACDFFARHLQANNRAIVIGAPAAGRGGGTDDFVLKYTRTEISFPLRERIPAEYLKSIESDVMDIDYCSEKEMKYLLDDIIKEIKPISVSSLR